MAGPGPSLLLCGRRHPEPVAWSFYALATLRAEDEQLLEPAAGLGVTAIDLLPAFGGACDLSHRWVTPFASHPDPAWSRLAGARLAEEFVRLSALRP